MSDAMDDKQGVSAMADGELQGEALDRCLATLARDEQARQAWQAYHLIGDVLRSSELARGTRSEVFMARLSSRLAAEPPHAQAHTPVPADRSVELFETEAELQARRVAEPANDTVFRWKLVAGVATLAVAVGWTLLVADSLPGAVVASGDRGTMIRDARLDELLAAHRQGGATALQTPTGFLHHATFQAPARGR